MEAAAFHYTTRVPSKDDVQNILEAERRHRHVGVILGQKSSIASLTRTVIKLLHDQLKRE